MGILDGKKFAYEQRVVCRLGEPHGDHYGTVIGVVNAQPALLTIWIVLLDAPLADGQRGISLTPSQMDAI